MRYACIAAAPMLIASTVAVAIQSTSTPTVAGVLSARCVISPADVEAGKIQYTLNGNLLTGISEDCTPGNDGTGYIIFSSVKRFSDRTIVVAVEGYNGFSQTVRVVSIERNGAVKSATFFGGDPSPLSVTSDFRVSFKLPGSGFAISDEHQSQWVCEHEIDFSSLIVDSTMSNPHEKGLSPSLCGGEANEISAPNSAGKNAAS